MYEYKAVIVNVVDGDTFDMNIDLGFHITIKERIRLLGIDTPEVRGDKEKRAGLAVANWAKKKFTGMNVRVRTEKGTDSFGRWLAYVVLDNDELITSLYQKMGINKYDAGYSEENCFALEEPLTGKVNKKFSWE